MTLTIRDAVATDSPAIARLVNDEIATATSTWATSAREPDEMAALLEARAAAGYPTLVGEREGVFAGYAALAPFRPQEGFAPTAEVSVYVEPRLRGAGTGMALLSAVARRARAESFAVLVACVGADNERSLRLHARAGFTEAGRLPAVGRKFGRWLDLVLLIRRL
ncbi:MAG: N-acetyltransferase family protein [Rhodobacteraceae bacterium]|nr:MAG: N-acetyltransferase family protein [Paracoccaceae bacterium]